MKQEWSPSWKKSTQVRKQRKYRAKAPMHVKRAFLGSHLSKELRQKYHTRSATVRVGDKVKIMRGQFKGKSGKVTRIDTKMTKVYVDGVELLKKDGAKAFPSTDPSNLLITELKMDDKTRLKTKRKEQ
ncbi:50S ribosomal protein L24 [Candidatus Woesearchaeota archaeon]|nr:50S ribosomal protein L24 [Candidatus Woesearchaeota archaeon]